MHTVCVIITYAKPLLYTTIMTKPFYIKRVSMKTVSTELYDCKKAGGLYLSFNPLCQRLFNYLDDNPLSTNYKHPDPLKYDMRCMDTAAKAHSFVNLTSVANSWQNIPASPPEKILPLRKKVRPLSNLL